MARHRYIVSYDITDDRRRNTVFKILLGQGDHAQYSVFFCDLNKRELAELRGRLTAVIHHHDDQIFIIDLGRASAPMDQALECLGRPYLPPERVLVV